MRRLLKAFATAALLALPLCAYAQSAAEIDAAKSIARNYGYTDKEIEAVLNHDITQGSVAPDVPVDANTAGLTSAVNLATANPVISEAPLLETPEEMTTITPVAPEAPTVSDEIYGHSYFTSQGLSVIPSYNAPAPASYVLGPGDEIVIDVWGATNSHVVATVGNDGSISVFDLGPVYVAGMNIKNAESYLKAELSRIYSGLSNDGSGADTYMRLSVGKIKGVVVSVTGEVAVPGVYTIPSLSSITSAIFMAGGVTERASVRNIIVYRNGRKVGSFDLYELIFRGKMNQNLRLQENDIISVEPYTNVVTISGAIVRPMRYEIKEGETIKDLIEYAGGYRSDSYKEELNVVRNNGITGESFDVNYSQYASFKLKDMDQVSLRSNPEVLANKVSITGPVNHPGTYAISGLTQDVASLIQAAGGLKEGAYMYRGQINRIDKDRKPIFLTFDLEKLLNGEERVELIREDQVTLFSQTDFLEDFQVSISGHVLRPGAFQFFEGMTVADVILLAGGLREDAYTGRGQISRTDHQGIPQFVSFSVEEALNGTENIALMRSDAIRIFSIRELKEDATVEINGEVQNPQSTTYREGMTLFDLLMISGGFTNGADQSNIEISSRGGKKRGTVATFNAEENPEVLGIELKPYDIVSIKRLTYFKPQTAVTIEGEVMTPGTYVIDKPEVRLSDIFEKVGGFTDEAWIHGARLIRVLTYEEMERQRLAIMIANQNLSEASQIVLGELADSYYIGIELDKALENPGSKYDIVLRAGDIITVPVKNTTVKVTGGVFYPNTVSYDPTYTWRQYVSQAGGFTKDARKRKTYAIHMNGKVSTVKLGMKVEPGSQIVVPQRKEEDREPMSPAEIAAIASSTSSIATLVAVLVRAFS